MSQVNEISADEIAPVADAHVRAVKTQNTHTPQNKRNRTVEKTKVMT